MTTTGNGRRTDENGGSEELRLVDIELREEVELVRFDLPLEQVEPLLERGVLPGCRLCPIRLSPSGDPIVMVDGSLLAFRRELACCLRVRKDATDAQQVA